MEHKLEIIDRQVSLDGFEIKGVTDYELKSSANSGLAELTLKLVVKDLSIRYKDNFGAFVPETADGIIKNRNKRKCSNN